MRVHRRTTLAAVLIGVSVLLPTAAWYATGSKEAERRAATLEAEAIRKQRDEVEREAERLGSRLEALREQESQRPFFHYQTLYRDPRGAAEGRAVTPSPLTTGASDPLVWAHFQIDENGLVTLPAVSEKFPELSSAEDFGAFCSLLEELQSAVLMDEVVAPNAAADEERLLPMSRLEWEQIALADAVYASITGRQDEPAGPHPPSSDAGRVVIRVRPLRWHTLVLGSGPALAALREVHTPAGVVLQGIAIAPLAVEQWIEAGSQNLRFVPVSATAAASISGVVGFTDWILELGSQPPAGLAQARAVVSQFRRNFALTAGTLLLAACAVILILLQTDRLARQRARFAAAAAHELKTPLAGLMLHAEMLAENLGDEKHRSQYASTVSTEAQRLGRVVGNMLDLAKLERSTPMVAPVVGEPGSAVEDLVARQRGRLEAAGVDVELKIETGLPKALFDLDALGQILDNLLDNAEKHTRDTSDRQVMVRVRSAGDSIAVEVADNGPGIPRSQRRAMFRPFDRSEDAVGRPGLGLGLAVARSLARAQNGDLELGASEHPGATLVLTIPRARS
jgi:signal transduction histidine kinase